MDDCLKLLHFHLGSQITNIRNVKGALNEAARVYAELASSAPACSTSTSAAAWASTTTARRPTSSRASTTRSQEYANDVVFRIKRVCDEAGVAHPTIISESGRAVVAYHSVLVFDVLGVSDFGDETVPTAATRTWEQPLTDLFETYQRRHAPATRSRSYHDAQQALDVALNLFNLGYLPLEQRAWPRGSSGPSAPSS